MKIRKIKLGLGLITAVIAPVIGVVSCTKQSTPVVKQSAPVVKSPDSEIFGYKPLSINRDQIVEQGDAIKIDFEGRAGYDWDASKPFDGGTAHDYQVQIGYTHFIDGFLEQLIGMTVKEQRIIRVYFPDDYNETSLAGKPAMFKVKINSMIMKLADIIALNKQKQIENQTNEPKTN